MAAATNIVKLADFRQVRDPAFLAKKRLEAAGEDDDLAYDLAVIDLETKQPTTLLGARAKLERLHWYLNFIRQHNDEGCAIGADDWNIVEGLYESIDGLLEKMTAHHVAPAAARR